MHGMKRSWTFTLKLGEIAFLYFLKSGKHKSLHIINRKQSMRMVIWGLPYLEIYYLGVSFFCFLLALWNHRSSIASWMETATTVSLTACFLLSLLCFIFNFVIFQHVIYFGASAHFFHPGNLNMQTFVWLLILPHNYAVNFSRVYFPFW